MTHTQFLDYENPQPVLGNITPERIINRGWPQPLSFSCGWQPCFQSNWLSKLWLSPIVGYHGPHGSKFIKLYQNHSWLVVSTPLKNMKVSWDDSSQYMESHKGHVPNHQPDRFSVWLVLTMYQPPIGIPNFDPSNGWIYGTSRPTGREDASAAWSGTPGEVLGRA